MSQIYLKNIPHESIFELVGQVQTIPGQIVSKTLAQNSAVSITLFAFGKGEEIGTHDSDGDAMVSVLEGTGKFIVDGHEYILKTGQSLVMPANKPHSVYGEEDFKMILTVIFPSSK
ncbi:cupin domain-containing protein [Parasporobacterium paucivorans]|uniref:Cupin domain protein n=1 Tax=Parasporobacterium paucivorans DSM 15970 TaxID=1122934 RepID=A0A1M6HJB7_9FIRM|nr:cupin domain-containing protein [Parasporobacterium paucivorans]SHJ22262.1 Cupin domain protein [Parasporobacterium paucivorans DSM 15970]